MASNSSDLDEFSGSENEQQSNNRYKKIPQNLEKPLIIPAYTKNFIDAINPVQNRKESLFLDTEVREVFNIIDQPKNGYITAEQLSFFMDVLDFDCTQEEIDQMIKMCDGEGLLNLELKGRGRVKFEEFLKVANNQSLAPIGQAFPPTIQMLKKKKSIGTSKQKYDQNKEIIPQQMSVKSVQKKVKPSEKKELIHQFAVCNNLKNKQKYQKIFQNIVNQEQQNLIQCTYTNFLLLFQCKDSDFNKQIFQMSQSEVDNLNVINIIEFCIGFIEIQDITLSNKLENAFYLYDDKKQDQISKENLIKIIQLFNFESTPVKAQNKFKMLQIDSNIEFISRDMMIQLLNQQPSLFV